MEHYLQLAKYYPPVKGGIELVEKMMTKALVELGHKVTILCFSKNTNRRIGEFHESIFEYKENINIASAPFSLKLFLDFKSIVLEKKITKILVHLPNPEAHEIIKIHDSFLKKHKIEVIAVYHSDIVNKKIFGEMYNWYFQKTLGIYSRWIVSSQKLINSSSVLSHIKIERFVIIPFCSEGLMNYSVRSHFNNKIVTVGRMVPYKGFDFIIDSIRQTAFELHLIGGGPLFKKLFAKKSDNIHFHQNATEIEKSHVLEHASVMVIGSMNNAEAYGMSIVEAFESGLLVVAPDLPTGVTFLVQDQVTGVVYKRGNEKDLIEKLNLIAKDPNLYKKLTSNAREFYEKQLNYDTFKLKMEKL